MIFIQKQIIKWLTRNLIHGISKEDILEIRPSKENPYKKVVSYRGQALTPNQIQDLKTECEEFKETFFWKEVCQRAIRYTAQERGMSGSRVDGDLWLAKGMILDLDIINQIIEDIKSL